MKWIVLTWWSWGRCPEVSAVYGPFSTVDEAQAFAAQKQINEGVSHVNVEELVQATPAT